MKVVRERRRRFRDTIAPMSLRRAAAVAALCLAGCTLDYDAILDAAEEAAASGASTGGGGEDPAASNASSSSAASTASAGTATTTSSSSASTTTASGGGGGGAGDGGADAAGGAGEGGSGGDGPVDLPSCLEVALDFDRDSVERAVGREWVVVGDQDLFVDGELDVEVDGGAATGIRTVAAVLFECSIAVTVTELNPFAESSDVVSVVLNAGVAELQVATADDPSPYCKIINGVNVTDDCLDSNGALELRVRHTGSEICFDVATQGNEPMPTGDCVTSSSPQRVSITLRSVGAASVSFDDVR